MSRKNYYGDTGILHSQKAEEGARQLFEKIESDTLRMDILPNQYERFSGALEEEDYSAYNRFLQSVNGQMVLKMLEEENAGNFIKL